MSFSGGGSNVKGSETREQGDLVLNNTGTVSITADGNFNLDVVVPAGKIWRLKSFSARKDTGTYTIGTFQAQLINPSAAVMSIKDTTVQISNEWVGNYGIEIPAGWTIRFVVIVSGWSVIGNVISRLLYQEIDA